MNRLSFALSLALVAAPAIASAQDATIFVAPAATATNPAPKPYVWGPCRDGVLTQKMKAGDAPICGVYQGLPNPNGSLRAGRFLIYAIAPDATGWKTSLGTAIKLTLTLGSGYTRIFNIPTDNGLIRFDMPLPCGETAVKSITFGEYHLTDKDYSIDDMPDPNGTMSSWMCETKATSASDIDYMQ